MIKHTTGDKSKVQARESFAVMFERVPGGCRIQIAIVDADGHRTLHRPRGPEVCTGLTTVAEAAEVQERLEDWLAGKFEPGDDPMLESCT